ncbi:hypothetical protein M413DRAFT_437895 [Hebeloma cylindrosporum]|uniref:Uncharacterized protein n=1 Tax=Hebeloma cylindrosporum TaxID=76867 RepID=A0A0C3CY27_HEBCY|nr:hypothetical protein M413DRAFT_437895 [Hebeloma cylindrosporum h7]
MAHATTIAVHITLKDGDDIERHVLLPNVKRPVEYRVLAEHISEMGYPACSVFTSQTEFELEVTAGQSSFDEGTGGTINLDQPLITYYNDCYLPVVCPQNKIRPDQCSGAEILPDERIKIGDLATVGFQRTIRVPDGDKTQALPPDMGPFPV